MRLTAEQLAEVRRLHDQGLNLQAFSLANSIAPLADWEGVEASLLAAHLAYQLGAEKLSDRWVRRAWREDPTHGEAAFYRASDIVNERGPIPALIFARKVDGTLKSDDRVTAWWHSLIAQILASLRDFKRAEERIADAFRADPDEPWLRVSQAHIYELQDRYDEAVAVAREGYELSPKRRTNIGYYVHLLQLQEKYDEALAVLQNAASELESGWIMRQLADLQSQLDDHESAYESLRKVPDLLPMRDTETDEAIFASLSDAAYMVGDIKAAIDYAEQSKTPFHLKVAEHLKSDQSGRRRTTLKTGFLRQHNVTCAPATIANISRFWGREARHLEIAEAICYDGTPAFKERDWAEANGWHAAEFTLSWDSMKSLIDRGIPFSLTTTFPGMGHMQAVTGYDEHRGTAIVRDPFLPQLREFAVDALLEDQKSSGPRCMAMVPAEKAEMLDGIDFIDREIYDLGHNAQIAIERHDRAHAAKVVAEMEAAFPDHRLTLAALWELHHYDSNGPRLFEVIGRFHDKFPKDTNIRLSYLGISADYVSRDERFAKLAEFANDRPSDPVLWLRYGDELGQDSASQNQALRWLWRALRASPANPEALRGLAAVLWAKQDRDQACELYRLAACLNDRDESLSWAYFQAARFNGREPEAIEFLQDRFRRFGHLSNYPARTLFEALLETSRAVEAFKVLERAAQQRSDDGELELFTASAMARYGRIDDAERHLLAAEGKAPRVSWLLEAAQIKMVGGDLAGALELLREVTVTDPTGADANSRIAFLISALEGQNAAREYLAELVANYPYNRGLRLQLLEYLKEEPADELRVLRELIQHNPRDGVAQRMLAGSLLGGGQTEEAMDAARTAIEIDPNDSRAHLLVGQILAAAGTNSEAAESFERAYKLQVDNHEALEGRLGLCRSADEKRAVLRDYFAEMSRQATGGVAMERYLDWAKRVMDRFELLEELRDYQKRNPDLWFAVSAVIQLLLDLRKYDEAATLADENARRFPLNSNVWYDLSQVHKLRGETEAEIDAIKRAVAVSPMWSWGVQALSGAYQRAGRLEDAEAVITAALGRLPLDHFLHGFLAEIRWKLGRRDEAIESAKRAVAIEPGYEWAWRVIGTWGEELGSSELAIELARDLAERKPNDVNAWVQLSRVLDKEHLANKQLEAANRALELEPADTRALALKAGALAKMRRFDEAIDICRTRRADGQRAENLRFVEARIELERGNTQAAVRKFENLGREAPDYYPAFEYLAMLYADAEGAAQDYLRVTREMTRLAPQDPTTFGYYGEACLKAGKGTEAREALAQAFRLAPDYTFAGATLFRLLLEDKDSDGALRIVQTLEAFKPDSICRRLRVELAAHHCDLEEARNRWSELCRDPDADLVQLEEAMKALANAGFDQDERIVETLKAASNDPNSSADAGSLIIRRQFRAGRPQAAEFDLKEMRANEKGWERAAITTIEELIRANKRQLQEFIERNKGELSANDRTWGSIGHAIQSVIGIREAEYWYAGWEKRDALPAYVFWNMFLVELFRNRLGNGFDLCRRGLEAVPDETVNEHLLILTIEAIQKGDIEGSRDLFSQINPSRFNEWTGFLYGFASEVVSLEARIEDAPEKDYDLEVGAVADAILELPDLRKDKMIRWLVDPVIKRLLTHCRNPLRKIWIRSSMEIHRHL